MDLVSRSVVLKKGRHVELEPFQIFPGRKMVINRALYVVEDYSNTYTRENLDQYNVHAIIVINPEDYSTLRETVNSIYRAQMTLKNCGICSTSSFSLGDDSAAIDINPGSFILEVVGTQTGIDNLNNPNSRVIAVGGIELADIVQKIHKHSIEDYSSLIVVLPDSIKNFGEIINDITKDGFLKITHLISTIFTPETFNLMFGCYKGVIDYYSELMINGTSAEHIGIIVTKTEKLPNTINVCEYVRQISGLAFMADPGIARALGPNTLLAKYGKSASKPGIIISEVPDYSNMECEAYLKLTSFM